MEIIFSDQPLPDYTTKSIFLAGPSPRSLDVFDWRVDAVAYLEHIGFDGVVYIPRWKSQFYKTIENGVFDYDNQIDWERDARNRADIIVFWLARDIKGKMPGMVTNFELGEDYKLGHVLYGRPDGADKIGYMDTCTPKEGLVVYTSLELILDTAVSQLGAGAYRTDGAERVPLIFWNHPSFKSWYNSLTAAGNKLLDFKVKSANMYSDGRLFSFVFQPSVWVNSENRAKSIEVVLSRPDISAVIPYVRNTDGEVFVVLVKEFRTAVNNPTGYVLELPSGSGEHDADPLLVARDELHEECGLLIEDLSRFKPVASRQLAATMLTHKASVFKINLTFDELEQIVQRSKQGTVLGKQTEDEQLTVEVVSMYDLLDTHIDFSMLGMIYQGLGR